MIFNCWLQIYRAKPINALIAFSPCLSRVRSKRQCIVRFYGSGCSLSAGFLSQKSRWYEADALAQYRHTHAPFLHFHIPDRLIVSTPSFILHTCILLPKLHFKSRSVCADEEGEEAKVTRNQV